MQQTHEHRPVSVLLQRDNVADAWGQRNWQVLGVVPESGAAPEQPTGSLARKGETACVYLWRGLKIWLNPESSHDYWLNLSSRQPLLFIVCQPDGDGELHPVTVSAEQDDGVAALEVDETVFATAMPAPIAAWVERYAYEHWRAGPHKTRKGRKPLDKLP